MILMWPRHEIPSRKGWHSHSIYRKLTNCGWKTCHGALEVKQLTKLKLLSALQLKNGVKRQEPTFVVIPSVYEEEGREPIPLEVNVVLKRYGAVMSDQLLKAFPPQREIDH